MSSERLSGLEQGLLNTVPLHVVRWYEEVGSTMSVGRELVPTLGLGEHGLAVASNQLAGRGRRGRVWVSETGGLMATYVHRIALTVEACGGLSLAVGVALHRYLTGLGVSVRLKWPNDIITPERLKLAGVLIEILPHGATELCILVGIGMNLNAPPRAIPEATSLADLGVPGVTPYNVLVDLTLHWLGVLEQFVSRGFAAVREEWIEGAAIVGQRVSVLQEGQKLEGQVDTIGNDGSLYIKQSSGLVVRCYSGEMLLAVND